MAALALLADRRRAHGLDAGQAKVGRRFGFQHHPVARALQERNDVTDRLVDAGGIVPHDERDGFLRFRRAGMGISAVGIATRRRLTHNVCFCQKEVRQSMLYAWTV